MVARREISRPATPLAQRTLRNDISRVLREVEAGERFAITVNGRIVAELGPPTSPTTGTDWQTAHAVIRRSRERADPDFWDDIRSATRQPEEARDPWTPRDAAT